MFGGISREIWIVILPVSITGVVTLLVTILGLLKLQTLRIELNSRLTELIQVEREKAKLETLLSIVKKEIE